MVKSKKKGGAETWEHLNNPNFKPIEFDGFKKRQRFVSGDTNTVPLNIFSQSVSPKKRGIKMNKTPKTNFGSNFSKWQDNFLKSHPGLFYIFAEFIAELMVASALALFAFHMLPPELSHSVSQNTPYSSVLAITNDGFLFAGGEYGITSKKPIKKEPEVISGKKYIDSLTRRSENSFGLTLSGLPYKKQIKINFNSDNVTVEEE